MAQRVWEAPGPGLWQRDAVHSPHVATRYFTAIFNPAFDLGMRDAFRSYGILLDHFDIRMVGQRQFTRPRPIGAPEKASSPPPKFIFKLLFLLHPELRYRKKRAAKVFAIRQWRQERAWWRNELAPKLRRTNLELQQVDPEALDDVALRAHIEAATTAFIEGTKLHFRLFPGDMIPMGDWLRRTCEWTGVTPAEAMTILKGMAEPSVAPLELLDRLVEAIRSVPETIEILHDHSSDAHTRVERLQASSPEVARAMDAYLNEYGLHLVTGYDICDLTLSELPHVLLSTIAAHMDKRATTQDNNSTEQAAIKLRERVPAAARAEYDALLEEARFVYGFQEENVGITYLWPGGLIRRALLAAGERLVARGRVKHPEHLLDATPTEVNALLGGQGVAPSGDELADRAEERHLLDLEDMPLTLGEPEAPPPVDSLPSACARMMQAMLFYLSNANLGDADRVKIAKSRQETGSSTDSLSSAAFAAQERHLSGLGVSSGRYEGRARVARGPADFEKIEAGDILVARTTSPAYNVLLPLLGAVVTDRGGVLCHAAVIAREFGIPAVVGTNDATTRIPDGARIVVDGDRGAVEILP